MNQKQAIAVVIFVLSVSALFVFPQQNLLSAQGASSSSFSSSSARPGWIDIRAIKADGGWVAPNETTTGVLNMISEIRNATGKTLNLFAIAYGPEPAGQMIKGTNTTVNQFLLDAQNASGGGLVIPEANMMYYVSSRTNYPQYCDPLNSTNCGPSWFYQVTDELLNLQAVQSKANKILILDSYDQFCRNVPSGTAPEVIQNLKSQGWTKIMIKTILYACSDGGEAWAFVPTVNPLVNSSGDTVSPYMTPDLTPFEYMNSGQRGLVAFDRQVVNSPYAATGLAVFLSNLTVTEQASSLAHLADLRSTDNYTFIYPVLTYTSRNNVNYVWDASVTKQSNGQPFLNLIETLLTTYG